MTSEDITNDISLIISLIRNIRNIYNEIISIIRESSMNIIDSRTISTSKDIVHTHPMISHFLSALTSFKKNLVTSLIRNSLSSKINLSSTINSTSKYIKDSRHSARSNAWTSRVEETTIHRIIILIHSINSRVSLSIDCRSHIKTEISDIRNIITCTEVDLSKRTEEFHLSLAADHRILTADTIERITVLSISKTSIVVSHINLGIRLIEVVRSIISICPEHDIVLHVLSKSKSHEPVSVALLLNLSI